MKNNIFYDYFYMDLCNFVSDFYNRKVYFGKEIRKIDILYWDNIFITNQNEKCIFIQ